MDEVKKEARGWEWMVGCVVCELCFCGAHVIRVVLLFCVVSVCLCSG